MALWFDCLGLPITQVEVFGSFASGLSTWSSDVDLVVTGIMEQSKQTGGEMVTLGGVVVFWGDFKQSVPQQQMVPARAQLGGCRDG